MSKLRRLALVALVVGLAACSAKSEAVDPGPEKLDRWLGQYVELLNDRDAPGLAKHLDVQAGAADVADRLAKYGGRDLRDIRIAHRSEFPRVYAVTIEAISGAEQRPIKMRETVEWDDERWHLAPLRPPATPSGAGTVRPSS